MAPRPQPLYAKDEKVLCFHHELLYEAKVLDVKPVDGDPKGGAFQYKVHYKGWKNTYVIFPFPTGSLNSPHLFPRPSRICLLPPQPLDLLSRPVPDKSHIWHCCDIWRLFTEVTCPLPSPLFFS